LDADTPITLAVAVHTDPLHAREDFAAVWETRPATKACPLAIAELARDAAGSLRVIRHKSTTTNVAWGMALLGAALVLVVAPAGARFLVSVPTVVGAGAVAGHLHRSIPRQKRDRATALLEGHDAGVVLLAVNRCPADVEPLLSRADETLAMASVWDGIDRAIEQEIAEAQVNPSGT